MRNIKFLLILVVFNLLGCNDEECNESCFTPPNNFAFEIIDKTSGENLFTNETYNPADISITDALNNNESVAFNFISENNLNLIQVGSIGWETEIVDLKFEIADDRIFNLYIDAERLDGDCCSFTRYNEITISEAEYELDSQTGVYKILVE